PARPLAAQRRRHADRRVTGRVELLRLRDVPEPGFRRERGRDARRRMRGAGEDLAPWDRPDERSLDELVALAVGAGGTERSGMRQAQPADPGRSDEPAFAALPRQAARSDRPDGRGRTLAARRPGPLRSVSGRAIGQRLVRRRSQGAQTHISEPASATQAPTDFWPWREPRPSGFSAPIPAGDAPFHWTRSCACQAPAAPV